MNLLNAFVPNLTTTLGLIFLCVFVQTFLSKLNPFLEVPSSKLTRWHPHFALDSVPDIEPSDLPAAPVKVYQTAGEVLEAARGRLPSRVRGCLIRDATGLLSVPVTSTSCSRLRNTIKAILGIALLTWRRPTS